MEKQVFTYELTVKGVFGRNRTVKFKVFRLVEHCETQKTLEEILPLAKAKIEELKIKPGAYMRLLEQPQTLQTHEANGKEIQMELTACFSHKVLYQITT